MCFCTNESAKKFFALLRVGVSFCVCVTVYFCAFRHVVVCGRIYNMTDSSEPTQTLLWTQSSFTHRLYFHVCEGFIC